MKIQKLKEFLQQCIRVWNVTTKPTNEEVKSIAKSSAIGIVAIGAIGFFIVLIVGIIF